MEIPFNCKYIILNYINVKTNIVKNYINLKRCCA